MPQKVILDVDTGTDDAVALMVAALSPELELVGATTVNGNTLVQNCTENTLRVFDYIGKSHIPVFEGMSEPMVRPNRQQVISAKGIHGDFLDLPPSRSNSRAFSSASSRRTGGRPCWSRLTCSPRHQV
jgi:inosine-uridine nucleoside N-ribohydrolase